MWIEKLSFGVLRVLTPMGPRYIQPSLRQRIYLLWIFRHFQMLPLQVLSARQRKMIEVMCGEHRFISSPALGMEDSPVLGTVESRAANEEENSRPAPAAAVPAVMARAARAMQRS